jgi:ribose transport system permease protein
MASETQSPTEATTVVPAKEEGWPKLALLYLARASGRALWRTYTGENSGILVVAMLVTIAVFAILLRNQGFLTSSNLLDIVRISTPITIMAVPTVFVIACGEIDLSFASVIPNAGLIAAVLMTWGYGAFFSAFVALMFGIGIGLANGIITVALRIPSFVVTLGMLGILQGLSQLITNTNTISIGNSRYLYWFGGGDVGSIPILDLWSLAALVIGSVVLSWTAVGRRVLATGANPSAARFSGISTARIKIGALAASGAAGALAGLHYAAQYGAAEYTTGSTDLLTVIAAAIIGGTALAGGKGSVVGAVVGSLLIGTLNNALILLGLGAPQQLMARGIIIVVAVIVASRTVSRRRVWPWLARVEARTEGVRLTRPRASPASADA